MRQAAADREVQEKLGSPVVVMRSQMSTTAAPIRAVVFSTQGLAVFGSAVAVILNSLH
jgi:hypothetical protein